MSHKVVVKFAPVFTVERFDDPAWRSERTMYYNGALQFLPGRSTVPLLVDHDREIGTVHTLFRMEWTDGPWLCARATIDAPPSWLKRGTRASFGSKVLDRRDFNVRGTHADIVASALVDEVSVLIGQTPVEPCAEVLSVQREEPPAHTDRPIAGEVVITSPRLVRRTRPKQFFTDDEIRDRLDRAADTGVPGAFELELEHMKKLEAAWKHGYLPASLDSAYAGGHVDG